MGASGWRYTAPYDSDFQVALDRLREDTFRRGDYWWVGGSEWRVPDERRPRPETLAELLADEEVETEGTHSIIDCPRIVTTLPASAMEWATVDYFGTIIPMTEAELTAVIGTTRPTTEHLAALEAKTSQARWVGRCTVLYSPSGSPDQLAFWGYSGD
jgi:hypothetical protein